MEARGRKESERARRRGKESSRAKESKRERERDSAPSVGDA